MKQMVLFALLSLPIFSLAEPANFVESVRDGKLIFGLRFRAEFVDFDSFDKDATAFTLRTNLGYETATWRGLQFLAEFENVFALDDDGYNSTDNGVTNRPVVADPEDTEINRVHLTYQISDGQQLTLGRQRVILDDARFVGNVGWRQNEQTYDAVRYAAKGERFQSDLIYIANVNRIFGENHPTNSDFRMASFLGNLSYEVSDSLKLSGFAYFLEFENAAALSHRVLGVRGSGQYPAKAKSAITYAFSYADQQDWQNDLVERDSDYVMASVGGKFDRWSVSGHYEVLGAGDSGPAFATPLATLHGFNGWADVFLNTPANGLEDLFVKVGLKLERLNLVLVQHHFSAEEGSATYGTETDFLITGKFNNRLSWGGKAALYDSDELATDITKVWAWLAFSY